MSYSSKPSRRIFRKALEAQKMSAEERDALRATLIRAKLKGVPEPDTEDYDKTLGTSGK